MLQLDGGFFLSEFGLVFLFLLVLELSSFLKEAKFNKSCFFFFKCYCWVYLVIVILHFDFDLLLDLDWLSPILSFYFRLGFDQLWGNYLILCSGCFQFLLPPASLIVTTHVSSCRFCSLTVPPVPVPHFTIKLISFLPVSLLVVFISVKKNLNQR